MAPLRWGLLGTARINRLIIPAIRASPRSVVHAVGSRDEARARAYANTWAIPHAFGSYDDLLNSDIDVLYVSLPNTLHVPWTLRAVSAGRHVLCEKPLALTADDVRRVADASTERRLVVTEGYMYRHHAQSSRLSALIAEGAVGAIRTIVGGFTYMRDRADDVRLDPGLGGGALWDVGCYPVSFGQWMAGAPPAAVIASRQMTASGVDEAFAGIVTYGNGVTLQFHCGFGAAYDTLLRIIGTAGAIEIPRPYRPEERSEIVVHHGDTMQRLEITGHAPFVDEIIDMENAVLDGGAPGMSLEESHRLAATLASLHESARQQCAITIA